MLRKQIRALTLLVVAVGLVGVPAGTAIGHNGHNTSTTFGFTDFPSSTGDNFSGVVSAGPLGCRKHRTVHVYRGNAGGRVLVGTDATSSTGAWSVPSEDPLTSSPSDSFWARVKSKSLNSHTCKPETSAAISGFTDN